MQGTGLASKSLSIAGHDMVVRDLTPGDMADVLDLHRLVFGGDASAQWYEWKYRLGQGEAVGVWCGNDLIAHCAGLPRTFLHQGVPRLDLQIGDVMVAPQWRGILTRQGPFFHASNGLYASRLGKNRPYAVGFGFPNARHLRLAVKSGLSWDAGVLHELQWDLKNVKEASTRFWRIEPVSAQAPGFLQVVETSWLRMQKDIQNWSIGDRSSRYVQWRYAQRPQTSPIFVQVRRPWRLKPEGVAVMAPVVPGQAVHWLDWIGPVSLMPLASQACRRVASAMGASGLVTWASSAVESVLGDSDGCSSSTEICGIGVPVASALDEPDVAQLNWWFMSGDTDFL